jgi:hypothetical protein
MKVIRTISAILLAFLVLVTSTSFMVGMHFCQGEVQNVALFSKAKACEKEQSLPPCHRHTKAPCCEDETIVHRGDDFKSSPGQFHVSAPVLADMEQVMVVISEIIPSAFVSRSRFYNYDPPLRSHDLTVEHQVFLI